MEDRWHYLDPDNNKSNPKTGLFCCRCKRKIKETQSFENFISVEMHDTHYWVKPSINGKHLLGLECAKKLETVDSLTDALASQKL
jgi:hypothetical protein